MSGFSNSRSAIDNVAKQYGSILRGYGPPVPKAGVVGDLYIDVQTLQLFEKRSTGQIDDWGHYLFMVPPTFVNTLKWFGTSRPSDNLGIAGDYFMQWAGFPNYGMQLTIFGPKLVGGWPENGGSDASGGPIITVASVYRVGLQADGSVLTDLLPSQLIGIGLLNEYVIPLSVTSNPGDTVSQIGVPSTGKLVNVTINSLYTAEDEHGL